MSRKLEPKADQALDYAVKQSKTARNWTELHNALFGIGGKISELFPKVKDRAAFAGTSQFGQICELIAELRKRCGDPPAVPLAPANGAISVRLPRSIHAALLAEAQTEGVSLNQLCVSKLALQLRAAVSGH